jgi:Peptidase family M41
LLDRCRFPENEQATTLARQMVAMFGMSDVAGLAHCARRDGQIEAYLPNAPAQRDCREETAREIEEEVKKNPGRGIRRGPESIAAAPRLRKYRTLPVAKGKHGAKTSKQLLDQAEPSGPPGFKNQTPG